MIYSLAMGLVPTRAFACKICERVVPYATPLSLSLSLLHIQHTHAHMYTHCQSLLSLPRSWTAQERRYCYRHIQSNLSLPRLYSILLPYNQCYYPPSSLFTTFISLVSSSTSISSSIFFSSPHPTLAFIPHAILKPRQLAVGVVARDGERECDSFTRVSQSYAWWGCLGYDWLSARVNPWDRPHPGMSQSTPVNPAGWAFHPESAENEGESTSGKDIPDVSNSPEWVELLKREGDNLGQMIASSHERGGKHLLVFNDVVVNVLLHWWKLRHSTKWRNDNVQISS